MRAHAAIAEIVSEMEIVFDLLDLLSGKGYPPFFGPQSYLQRVKEYYDARDEAGKGFVKATLEWLRDSDPSARVIAYYCRCVEEKQEETRQWLSRLHAELPPEIKDILSESPTEEMCRQDLKEQAAYALELLNEMEEADNE